MKPVENFEGCGSCNNIIKTYIEKQFSILNDMLINMKGADQSDKYKFWLIACLAKTVKEQAGLLKPILFGG